MEIADKVKIAIREGEGLTVEFKEKYTSRIDEDMVAFAQSGPVELHRRLHQTGETTVVFRDRAFADDVAKTNLFAIFPQNGLG